MREREHMAGWFHGQAPVDPEADIRLVGGAGIFQIFETKPEHDLEKHQPINPVVAKWRIDSIRNGKALQPLDELLAPKYEH